MRTRREGERGRESEAGGRKGEEPSLSNDLSRKGARRGREFEFLFEFQEEGRPLFSRPKVQEQTQAREGKGRKAEEGMAAENWIRSAGEELEV